MNKILVPVDGSELSESALPMADKLAGAFDAEVVLISVTELAESAVQAREAESATGSYLDRVARKISSRVRSYPELAGDPKRGILQAIEDEKPMMVVMSTHGRSTTGELFQGSVSNEVLQSATVPVLLVPPPAQP